MLNRLTHFELWLKRILIRSDLHVWVDFESGQVRKLTENTVIFGKQYICYVALTVWRQRKTFFLTQALVNLKSFKILHLTEKTFKLLAGFDFFRTFI